MGKSNHSGDWLIGQRIGNFRVIRLLGSGHFGSVYLAENVGVRKIKVAIKVLHAYHLTDRDREQFRREAEIIATLEQSHIVRIRDFSTLSDGTPYIVMDYKSGDSLRKACPRGTCVDPRTVVDYILQAGAALQFAHDKGVIHRDIKPENMLLDEHGALFLSDFGIAVTASSKPNASRRGADRFPTGTYFYTPPEYFDNSSRPSAAGDQYSLGVVAYELLCGSLPFEGSPWEVVLAHVNTPPESFQKKNPAVHVPAAIEAVVMKALAKKPEQRYPSVMEFAEALEAAARRLPPRRQQRGLQLQRREILTVAAWGTVLMVSAEVGDLVKRIRDANMRPGKKKKPTAPGVPVPKVGDLLATYLGHHAEVTAVVWAPDGKHLVSGAADGEVHLWIIKGKSGYNLRVISGHSAPITGISWTYDARYLALSRTAVLQIRDALTGNPLPGLIDYQDSNGSGTSAVVWSPDRRNDHLAAIVNNNVLVFDSPIQASGWGQIDETYGGQDDQINALSWSPDGKKIATAQGLIVQVWEAESGRLLFSYKGPGAPVTSVAWSPTGRFIVSGDNDGVIHVAYAEPMDDATAGMCYYSPVAAHQGAVASLAWDPDGLHFASGGVDGLVQVWRMETGSFTRMFTRKHDGGVNQVIWSPDGKAIASASDDMTVQVWRAV